MVKRIAEELWLCKLIDGETAQPIPIHKLCMPKVESLLNLLRSTNRSKDHDIQRELSQSHIRNDSRPDLLMLLGLPEFDRVVPTITPLSVSKNTSKNIQSAWRVWSALLHDDEMPDYSSISTNIVRAVEEEFLSLFFEPFFSTDMIKNIEIKRNEIKLIESTGSSGYGLRWLYTLQEKWPAKKPAAGDISSILSSGLKSINPDDPELVRHWKAFCMSRWAVVRPSLSPTLKLFADLRNPKTHGGRGITEKESAIIHRGIGWSLLRALSKLHVIEPGSESRYSSKHREEILNHQGWANEDIKKVKYWEKSLPEATLFQPTTY